MGTPGKRSAGRVTSHVWLTDANAAVPVSATREITCLLGACSSAADVSAPQWAPGQCLSGWPAPEHC